MLRMISFSLFVRPEQFERYRGSLYSHITVPFSHSIAHIGASTSSPSAVNAAVAPCLHSSDVAQPMPHNTRGYSFLVQEPMAEMQVADLPE